MKNIQRFCGNPRPFIIICQPRADVSRAQKMIENKKTADSVIFLKFVFFYSLVKRRTGNSK